MWPLAGLAQLAIKRFFGAAVSFLQLPRPPFQRALHGVLFLRPSSSFNLARIADLPEQFLRKFLEIRLPGLLWCCQAAHDFPLTRTSNLAIAQKGRHDFFMPEVLR